MSIRGIYILVCGSDLTLHHTYPEVWSHYRSKRCRFSPIRSDHAQKNARMVGPEDQIRGANLIACGFEQGYFISVLSKLKVLKKKKHLCMF